MVGVSLADHSSSSGKLSGCGSYLGFPVGPQMIIDVFCHPTINCRCSNEGITQKLPIFHLPQKMSTRVSIVFSYDIACCHYSAYVPSYLWHILHVKIPKFCSTTIIVLILLILSRINMGGGNFATTTTERTSLRPINSKNIRVAQ